MSTRVTLGDDNTVNEPFEYPAPDGSVYRDTFVFTPEQMLEWNGLTAAQKQERMHERWRVWREAVDAASSQPTPDRPEE